MLDKLSKFNNTLTYRTLSELLLIDPIFDRGKKKQEIAIKDEKLNYLHKNKIIKFRGKE